MKKRLRKRQKAMGFLLLLVSVIFLALTIPAKEDCGGGLLIGAFSLWLIFTKEIVIYR